MKKVSGTNCVLYYNSIFAILVIASTELTLIGGNTTNNLIAKLPSNVKLSLTSRSTAIMDASWRPTSNNGKINCTGTEYGEDITLRATVSANDAVVYEEIFVKRSDYHVK